MTHELAIAGEKRPVAMRRLGDIAARLIAAI
jgi:hypothetical protein